MDWDTFKRVLTYCKEGSKIISLMVVEWNGNNKQVLSFFIIKDKIIYGTFKNGDLRSIDVITDN